MNVLFLMADMMQARVLNPEHPCKTPNLDGLAARGVRFTRAYSPCPMCSPARASLMTGLLPHNHGVIENFHTVDEDQANLRAEKPHWAQRLKDGGFRTGYFGKWHVERGGHLDRFGWDSWMLAETEAHHELVRRKGGASRTVEDPTYSITQPPGYPPRLIYGVTDVPPDKREMGVTADLAEEFLSDCFKQPAYPWCCFVSLKEPHHPFVALRKTLEVYDIENIPLSGSVDDDLQNRPGLFRKVARVWSGLSRKQRQEASALYYSMITEVDALLGRLIRRLDESGQADETVVVFTSDHGQLDGAHGMYSMNITASEELHNIPLIVTGPGIAQNQVTDARVGLQDVCPTLLDLTEQRVIEVPDSKSFKQVLLDPGKCSADYTTGLSEHSGCRHKYSYRVLWDDRWKYVINGYDFDELYDLTEDPLEMRNLAGKPEYENLEKSLMIKAWDIMKKTGDDPLVQTDFPPMRQFPVGPAFQKPE